MVRKKLAMAILALSALQANFANALGLGNLSIKSALNQPLNAEIKLLDVGDLDPTQVKIQLATAEDFQRSGVDRDYFLTNLHFTVDMDGHGGGTIHVTTKEPVVEPYLNFVIEARWPSGRLLREFAVLLDPPAFSASKGAGAVAPAVAGGQSSKKAAIQPPTVTTETQPTKTVPEAEMSLPAAGKSGEYRVQVYDTLSKIAARYKPASDVSVAQTMLAIQRTNPDAFINNNINLIKSGAVVRLPSAEEARAVSADQAAQDAEEQTHAWRSGAGRSAGSSTAATGPQLDASAPEPSKSEGGYREKARLSIAAPGGSEKSSAGEGSGAGGKGVEALRNQLTASQEALEKGKRDNHELQSRLDDMERQIATLQRLISLKDDQLTALQAKSADKPATTKPAEPVAAAPAAPVSAPAPTPAAETSAPVAAAATQPAAAPAKPAPVAPKPKPAPAPELSLLEQITSNPLYLGGGAAAILLALVGGVMFKRRKDAEEEEDSGDDFTLDDGDTFPFAAIDSDDKSIADDTIIGDTTQHLADHVEPAAATEAPKKAVRSETGDAIAESDIYIAYGRYQQAVDLLSNAIDAEPTRSDLRVKLLEVYVEMRNRDAFREQFVALQGLGDSGAVAQVKDMLSSVDGVSGWLDGLSGGTSAFAASAAPVAAAAASAFVADKLFDETPEEQAVQAAESEGDLDLDLDFDEITESVADSESSLELEDDIEFPAETAAESDFEFNLDLDADTAASSSQELSDLTLDLERTAAPSEPAPNFAFANPDEELELDLGDDDLDEMLGELGGTDELMDLEDYATNAPAAPAPAEPAIEPAPAAFEPELDLSEEFDLSQAGEELDSESPSEIDVFGGLNQPAPGATDFDDSFGEPAPGAEPAFESAPVSAPTLDSGDDFDFLSDSDEVATKLDLARAYIDMGDTDGARDILDEVLQEGTDNQKQEASTLLSRIG